MIKRLKNKKVKIFKREISLFLIVLVGVIGLGSAALVPYISNTIFGSFTVSSPISIEITGSSSNVDVATNKTHFSADISGGEMFTIETTLTVGSTGVTGHLGEMMIKDFDGIGMDVTYKVTSPATGEVWNIFPCVDNGDTYYYIGDPGDTLQSGLSLVADTNVATALNLEPGTYESESRVILASERKCTGPSPTLVG